MDDLLKILAETRRLASDLEDSRRTFTPGMNLSTVSELTSRNLATIRTVGDVQRELSAMHKRDLNFLDGLAADVHTAMSPATRDFVQARMMAVGFQGQSEILKGLQPAVLKGLRSVSNPRIYDGVLAPWNDIARKSRDLLANLEGRGYFEEERGVSVPLETDSTEELLGELIVPNGPLLVSVGMVQLRLMLALLRRPEDIRQLDPRQFELLIAELLADQGYDDVQLTQATKDGGKDIIAYRLIDGRPSAMYFECGECQVRCRVRPHAAAA